MGRQNSDHTVVHSSIALLQERFRQLQRVKEMREERELLRLFSSEPERVSPTTRDAPSKLFFHPELIIPPRPTLQSSHFFQTESQSKCADFLAVDTPLLMSLWPTDRGIVRTSNNFDDADVDTSLHL
ncbi:hypothetical protein BVC80_1663g70 [Macleaya cordata]|uniref:Uncharacterized protein n=1 Tax=Macleaya cordata TaxID=56857 RepID=A0A200RBW5_MACCD|nr:hypothetical protein BVC80_1663g70 [Macleaya cordata]